MESEAVFRQRLESACALAEAPLEGAFGEQRADWSQARLQAEGAAWSLDEAALVALKMLAEVQEEI